MFVAKQEDQSAYETAGAKLHPNFIQLHPCKRHNLKLAGRLVPEACEKWRGTMDVCWNLPGLYVQLFPCCNHPINT